MTRGMDQGYQRGMGGVGAWEWEGTSTGAWDGAEAWRGARAWEGQEAWRRNEPGRVQEPERGHESGSGRGQLDRSLEGCKSLEVQASERGYQPGRRQEHERELKTEARERTGASLRGGRNREGTKGRSMGGDWQEPGSGRKQ